MARLVLVALLAVALGPCAAAAHDLQREVGRGEGAVSVRLYFADGSPFSFEAYEVYRAGEEIPFQVGRTDANGRLVFLPDRAGAWRIKAFSEDGHGLDFSVTTEAGGTVMKGDGGLVEGHSRLVVGISVLFGIFGLWKLFASRRL